MLTTLIVFCLLYTLLCAVAMVSSFATSSRRATAENELQQQGIRISGRLAGQVSPRIAVTSLPFTYEYAGKMYRQRQWVSWQYAEVFRAETAVTLLSLPEKPERAMLAHISPDHWESQILKRWTRSALILFCLGVLFSILLLTISR